MHEFQQSGVKFGTTTQELLFVREGKQYITKLKQRPEELAAACLGIVELMMPWPVVTDGAAASFKSFDGLEKLAP